MPTGQKTAVAYFTAGKADKLGQVRSDRVRSMWLVQLTEKEDDTPFFFFLTEFQLDPVRVQFDPNEDEFQECIANIMDQFQQTTMMNHNLVSDSYFNAFTRSNAQHSSLFS